MTANSLTIKVQSRSHLEGLRVVIDHCDDVEDAKPIYRELMRLACKMADKHKFERKLRQVRDSIAVSR